MPITTSAVELVVRPSDSGGGGEAGCDSDYEPGEVRRDPPPYSRSDRFSDNLTRLQNLNPSPNSNSRLRVGSLNSGSGGSVLIDCLKNKEGGVKEEENQENKNVDVGGVETSFGEIVLEFEGTERLADTVGKRESEAYQIVNLIFQRYPRPEKEYQSFSLIYNGRSLDLICKDKDEAEQWFIGLKALISRGHQRKWRTKSRSDGIPSKANSPRTYTRRSSPLNSPFGSGDSL